MKATFKSLSLTFFISLMLLTCPLYSKAEEEAFAPTKDIQLLLSDNKEIKVSLEDIKERLLNGEPVHFVENQEETKRTIKAEWITNALKKKYGVEKIDIKNAIITGDLDFHMKEYLLDVELSGIEVNKLKDKKRGVYTTFIYGLQKVFLVSASINVESCQLQGNLEANYDKNLKTIVIFESNVSFNSSKFFQKANFVNVMFNGEVDFIGANFEKVAVFDNTNFNGEADFSNSSFKKAGFFCVIFDGKVTFLDSSFNGEAQFSNSSFNGEASFRFSSFNGRAGFWGSRFNGEASFQDSSFNGRVYFEDALFNGKATFKQVRFKDGVDFSEAVFNGQTDFSNASLEKANLMYVDMSNAKWINTNLKDAKFSGVNLTKSQYEPISSPHKGYLGGIKGLDKVWFYKEKQSGLVQLRAALKEAGLRGLEREATYAIEHWKAHYEPWYKK